MTCSKCGHQTDGGKFCENCGTNLNADSESVQNAAGSENVQNAADRSQSQRYVEATKKASSMYFSFCLRVLKRPYTEMKHAGEQHIANSIITMAVFALAVSLSFYFGLKGFFDSLGQYSGVFSQSYAMPTFFEIAVKPAFTFAIYIFLLFVFTYAGLRIQGVQASFKEVLGRFGTVLIPFAALLLAALLLSLMKTSLFLHVLFFGLCGVVFLIPPAVLYSYQEKAKGAVDMIYATLLVYLMTFIAIRVMGDLFLEYLGGIGGSILSRMF
ncbi:zinc ribbon domain-containing protein [Bacillus swezeyi]|uniref:Zinc ribbon domain-containing protein n=1 Tax=Bacillus swezeyi TaxID=1925020 RepID=A0A1R1QCE9_9BACI|nr:zinc ribbon domain-containing protein [Bacillus swezeyi]MEC1259558.1 zinc ribbon domain-containing protein [Bacillus swezeyi]MED2927479.1 zinc ribbon domain-containing protein [Bacillus swezeyi]MED2941731.1 zinc ribbon domain-containing protein [Bacillus swezeyi]MED2962677.1 zinc ribbon domain-containing protein [Bacillus swezeyi]MED2977281.1 zinc ribbon domain-containing protein [Bacillus swezeyi]